MFGKFLLLVVFSYTVSSRELPSFVHLCKRNDPKLGECFLKSLYELMPRLTGGGIPEIDVPSIDPLQFSSIKVDTGNTASVNLVIDLIEGTVAGLRKMKIKNHIMDLDNVRSTVKLHLPEVNIEASYTMVGKILLFELNGNGHASYNATDLTTDAVWTGSYYTKKGKKHIRLEHIQFDNVKIPKMAVKFDGLFGENKALTETVNNALNENIDTLKIELEPLVKTVLADIIVEYFNNVYRLFPTEELFPEK